MNNPKTRADERMIEGKEAQGRNDRKTEGSDRGNDSGNQNSTTPSQYAAIVGAILGDGDTVSYEVTLRNVRRREWPGARRKPT